MGKSWNLPFMQNPLYVLLLGMICISNYVALPNSRNVTDQLALVDLKNRITLDPLQIMSSWNDSVHFCRWVGVICSHSNDRVMILNLESKQLAGSMPPSIGNLTFLTGLNLRNNSFCGEIPREIGHLRSLRHLNLTYNYFDGKIPANLSHCVELEVLEFSRNKLVGQIPDQLSSLSNLLFLGLDENNLTGSIPSWIGNFSSLSLLSLSLNSLQGSIPNEFGQLSNLGFFQLYGNELSGTIPSSIYNISSLYYFSVTQNHLHGKLPEDVGLTLPNLEIFAGGVNYFTGRIPVSLANTSELKLIDFAENSMTGTVPTNLGKLQSLYRINFDDNSLGIGKFGGLNFLSSLANCSNLEVLGLARNHFGGELPNFIGNLSTYLQILTLGSNMIHGPVPYDIGILVNLYSLGLEQNYFSGSVPDSLGKLQKLQGLNLNLNRFSGPIPPSLGNLTSLTRLFMEGNRLEGIIPPKLGDCKNLLFLNLTSNNLNGSIPKELIGLSSLSIFLGLGNNSLTGSIPFEVGNLKNLKELDISDNKLSGQIPSSISSCISLERLAMEGNFLQGIIPETLNNLKSIVEIDLSNNNFSGQIPDFLGKLPLLKKLGLSDNNLDGQVPSEGIFTNASAISIFGNKYLCGGVPQLNLPPCSHGHTHSSRKFLTPKIVVPVAVGVVLSILLCSFASCFLIKRPRKDQLTGVEDHQLRISYAELSISTNGFSEQNLIGSGSFGSVYKGTLQNNGNIVAVKVLNLQQRGASESFMDECRALKSVKHRNLLKIITACSSIDRQGNDFKALIFEFMPNGNLDQWIHSRDQSSSGLDLDQRLNLAIDVASALEYLHHHCQIPIAHCDLKPSNILLDEDMTAHVGDFGLASFLTEASNDVPGNQNLSMVLKGSIGYIAPEIGLGGQASILGDVFSFGILLLEMFTGKRPTNEAFTNGLTLHSFVATALPEHVTDILDPSLLTEDENEIDNDIEDETNEQPLYTEDYKSKSIARSKMMECLTQVLRIGLSCSDPVPGERMPMDVAVNKILAIRNSFLRLQKRDRRAKYE